jgi:hypothetical protein
MKNRRFRIFLFSFTALLLIGFVTIGSVNPPPPPERAAIPPKFVDIEKERIKRIFNEVLAEYENLHPYEIVVQKARLKNSTMQAQPIITFKSLFSGVKRYTIKLGDYVRYSENIAIGEVPEDVLRGWFAHELGHIVDYEIRSNLGMVGFGLKYTLSDKFKKACEHEADSIAIEQGFHEEIIATKKFLLKNELISEEYKEKLRKYYMPIEGVRMCLKSNPPIEPTVDL